VERRFHCQHFLRIALTFRAAKDGKVFIHWHGKQIMILKGASAEKFMASMAGADAQQAQLLMAKITGHFKHGNER